MDYCSQISRLDEYTQERDPFSTELLNAVKTKEIRKSTSTICKKGHGMLAFFVN